MRNLLGLLILIVLPFFVAAQERQYKVACIGFYNFENLFDTLDTPQKYDEDFTPEGSYRYNTKIYLEKLGNLAQIVSEIGTDITPDGAAILGVAEVENRKVLEDFAQQPLVRDRNYQVVHYESPDERGIDVALLYQPKYFKVLSSHNYEVEIFDSNGERDYTRDVLRVSGLLDGEEVHVMVNHWPSRSGGEARSQPLRVAAAKVAKSIADSLRQANPNAKILIMGDLNDDPSNVSVEEVLQAKDKESRVRTGDMFNPMYEYYKKGIGTLAYRDAWNLFDQIILSKGLLDKQVGGCQYYKAQIINKPYLYQKTGQYKGYPYRTFAGSTYLGGYSDHFPVCVYLVKEVRP